jgi:acetoacetyl-CoA reductase
MSKTAIVTGGTRGIGAAISRMLKSAGYQVAANYAGNDDAAAAFAKETGIDVFKWSVASYEDCDAGVAAVEAKLGPVEVLVNNAGITRDSAFHKMTPQQWHDVIDTNLNGLFNMTHQVWGGMRDRNFGNDFIRHRIDHFGANIAGTNRINGDSLGGAFLGQGFGKAKIARLGR